RPTRRRCPPGALLDAPGPSIYTVARLMILLAHAELDGLICSGEIVSGEHTCALMAERVPTPRRLERTEALAELALRYFTGHGPADRTRPRLLGDARPHRRARRPAAGA